MTGPEHYRESERLLKVATTSPSGQQRVDCIAASHVHATLALAAATALSDPARSAPRATVPEWDAWQKAAGVSDSDAHYEIKDSFA